MSEQPDMAYANTVAREMRRQDAQPRTVKALLVPVGSEPRVIDIEPTDLFSIKAAIGGGWLEAVPVVGQPAHMYVDEEGRLKGLAPNWTASRLTDLGDTIVGPAIIFGDDNPSEGDVPERVVEMATQAWATRAVVFEGWMTDG